MAELNTTKTPEELIRSIAMARDTSALEPLVISLTPTVAQTIRKNVRKYQLRKVMERRIGGSLTFFLWENADGLAKANSVEDAVKSWVIQVVKTEITGNEGIKHGFVYSNDHRPIRHCVEGVIEQPNTNSHVSTFRYVPDSVTKPRLGKKHKLDK